MSIFKMPKRKSILILIVLLIAIITIFIIVGNNVLQYAFKQACSINLEILKQTKTSISSLIEDVNFVSRNILGNEEIIDIMRYAKYNDSLSNQRYQLGFTLNSLFLSREYIDSISIFNDKSIIVQFGNLVEKEDMSLAKEISDLKGRGLWTKTDYYKYPIYNKKTQPIITFYRALNDLYAMEQLGYQRISVKESYIKDLYKNLATENAQAFIVNNEGEIISAYNNELLGTSVLAQPYFQYIKQMEEGYVVTDKDVIFSYTLTNPNWHMIQIIPKYAMFARTNTVMNIMLLCMILCIACVMIFFVLQRKIIITEQSYQSKLLNREMELKYLQGQINPHFLYNTLDMIRWMAVKKKEDDIAQQVKALSDIFRHTLNSGMEFTTVEKEIDHVNKYMTIQKKRFGDRINYSINVQEDCLKLSVTNLILQPIVENAVVHGLEGIEENGKIHVDIYSQGDCLYYTVADNGVGFDTKNIAKKMDDPSEHHEVFALKNIDERLKLTYGNDYGISFESKEGEGSLIIIKQKINR